MHKNFQLLEQFLFLFSSHSVRESATARPSTIGPEMLQRPRCECCSIEPRNKRTKNLAPESWTRMSGDVSRPSDNEGRWEAIKIRILTVENARNRRRHSITTKQYPPWAFLPESRGLMIFGEPRIARGNSWRTGLADCPVEHVEDASNHGLQNSERIFWTNIRQLSSISHGTCILPVFSMQWIVNCSEVGSNKGFGLFE